MARPPTYLVRKIKDIPQHVESLPVESRAPILHYTHTSAATWISIEYIRKAVGEGNRSALVASRHLRKLYAMALINLIENFERLLKEMAAECVDSLSNFIVDDRLNVFKIQGSGLASHFATGTLGKSLCESATWLDCEEINDRFRKLLADPFQVGGQFFHLFPKQSQQPVAEQWRYEPMSLIWQIRHTAVHNVGVITRSDGVKLRLLARESVVAPRLLAPTRADIRNLMRFLDETAAACNSRVCTRLAELLTTLQERTPGLFEAQEMADRLAASFRIVVPVAGATGIVPPD